MEAGVIASKNNKIKQNDAPSEAVAVSFDLEHTVTIAVCSDLAGSRI